MKNNNITFNSNGIWNVMPLKVSISTNDFSADFKINDANNTEQYQVYARGELFQSSLISNRINITNTIISIYTKDANENILTVIEKVKNSKIFQGNYNIDLTNVIIQIIYQDETDKTKKNQTIAEYFIRKIIYNKMQTQYHTGIAINSKDNKMFFINIDSEKNSATDSNFAFKIQSESIDCKIYTNNGIGNINCNIRNILNLVDDIGIDTQTLHPIIIQLLKEHDLFIKGDIAFAKNFNALGAIKINNNIGEFSYNGELNNLNISFKKLDLDDYSKIPINNNSTNSIEIATIHNPWIDNAWKKSIQENNPLGKNMLYKLLEYIVQKPFDIRLKFDTGLFSKIKFNDAWLNIAKAQNTESIDLINAQLQFGDQGDTIKITPNKKSETNEIEINGTNFETLIDLFELNKLNTQQLSKLPYKITGTLDLAMYAYNLNANININQNNNITYQAINNQTDKYLKMQFSNNFNILSFFKPEDITNIINKHTTSLFEQQTQPIILQKMFNHITNNQYKTQNITLICDKCYFGNERINSMQFEYLLQNQTDLSIKLNLSSDSINDLKMNFTYSIPNQDINNSAINLILQTNNINLSLLNTNLYKPIWQKTFSPKDIIQDKSYSIPTFMNINGAYNIAIANINIDDNNYLQNFSTQGEVKNGNFFSKIYTKLNQQTEIAMNADIYLQSIPKFDIAFNFSGFKLSDITPQQTTVNGTMVTKGNFYTQGFNIIDAIKKSTTNATAQCLNCEIKNFNLTKISNSFINDNKEVKKDPKSISNTGSLFMNFNGNLNIENSLLTSSWKGKSKLVSSNVILKYDISKSIIQEMQAMFGLIYDIDDNDKPTMAYLPVACNGEIANSKCIIGWEKLVAKGGV